MKTSLLTYRHEDLLLAFIELLGRVFIRMLSAAKDTVPLDILLSHFNCKSLYKITHANSIHVTQVWFCLTYFHWTGLLYWEKEARQMLCSRTKEYIWNLMCENTNPVNCHLRLPLRCSILGPEEEKSESALLRSGILACNSHKQQSSPSHAYWHHDPMVYGLVIPSSKLIWRIIPEKYFPALARVM